MSIIKDNIFKNQLLHVINNISSDFFDILEILELSDIKIGNLGNINPNDKGIIIKTKYDNLYNLYSQEDFNAIVKFSRNILNTKDKYNKIDNWYLQSFINDLCNNIIDKINSNMSNNGLLPIFSALCGDEEQKNKYTIELFY